MSVINDDKDTLMIRCDCHGHVLEVASDDLGVGDGIEPDFYFSVWNQTPTPFNWKDRLRLIWRLIRGKNLEGGDVIVNLSDAIVIANFLLEKVTQDEILLTKQKEKKAQNAKENS
jgi:hypothetical protein